jgi:hypothetical protein
VKVHSLTFSRTPENMKCDFWASLLARTFASPCLGRKPKARVAITRVIFPQYWVQFKAKQKNLAQFSILKAHYCFGKHIGPKQLHISPLLNEALLVQQFFFSRLLCLLTTMQL